MCVFSVPHPMPLHKTRLQTVHVARASTFGVQDSLVIKLVIILVIRVMIRLVIRLVIRSCT
jgi:hypothetical protein